MKYAMLFRSINVIQYLLHNDAKLTVDLWPYAVHSNNVEIINNLFEEENKKFCNDFFLFILVF